MAEDAETVIEIEGDSEAAVALALTRMLLAAADAPERPTQADILSTFRAALAAVRGEEWIEVEEEFDDEEEGQDEEEEEEDEDAEEGRRR
jgi:hypothetical protein